jgi:hypothetical protein
MTSTFFHSTDLDAMSLSALVELAGQFGALLSYIQLIDTPQEALPRRIIPFKYEVPATPGRRNDDLQRNALGRKRRADTDGEK